MRFARSPASVDRAAQSSEYVGVLWDHDRKNVFALSSSPLVFINPPGVAGPRPYPVQYVYPDLEEVNQPRATGGFVPRRSAREQFILILTRRNFPPEPRRRLNSPLSNPTDVPWRQ